MDQIFGIIGTGNMGGALARAMAKSLGPQQLVLCNRTPEKAQALAQELGCSWADMQQVAKVADYILLGVKPHLIAPVLQELMPMLSRPVVLVSMAAGVTLQDLYAITGEQFPVIRIMPNTPVAVGSGIVLYTPGKGICPETVAPLRHALSQAGMMDEIPESLMDAAGTVAGCGPAYACMFLQALADGGVACGVPRQKAQQYAAQMLLGTAKMVLESDTHPEALKDAVCSPGGSTIAGVQALENGGFRGTVMSAVQASNARTKKLR